MLHYFHPLQDRLELTTSADEKLMLQWYSRGSDDGMFVFDPEYLPEPFTQIPALLMKYKGVAASNMEDDSWWVMLSDGTLTPNGPTIEFRAFGHGWSWKIHTRLHVQSIISIQRDYINKKNLAHSIQSVYLSGNTLEVDKAGAPSGHHR